MAATAIVAAAVLAAGCGGGSGSTDGGAQDVDASATQPAPDRATDADAGTDTSADDAPEILRFTSPLVGGGELDVAGLSTKPTAFWFWSPT